jgi:cell shape-determining protein MreC
MPNRKAKDRKHARAKRIKENKERKKAKRLEIKAIKDENIRLTEDLATCRAELEEAKK